MRQLGDFWQPLALLDSLHSYSIDVLGMELSIHRAGLALCIDVTYRTAQS